MESYQFLAAKAPPVSVGSSLTIFVVFLGITCLAQYKWKRRRLEKLGSLLPGPPALPIIGNYLEFGVNPENILATQESLSKIYESPYRIWFGPVLVVVIDKPEDIQIVMNSSKTLEKAPLYRFYQSITGSGLFCASVEKWKLHRRAIGAAFNMFLLEQFVPAFDHQSRILVEKMAKMVGKGIFDAWEFIFPASLDIICHTTTGGNFKFQDNRDSQFARAHERVNHLIFMRCIKFWLHPDFVFNRTSYAEEFRHFMKHLYDLPNSVIQQKKEEFRKKKEESKNKPESQQADIKANKNEKKLKFLVDILLKPNDSGTIFSDDDLRDEMITTITGASDTSALTNSFCLLMLAINEDIQNKAYEEVYSIFGDSDRGVTVGDLNRMVYLEMVIKETLRKFPPGTLILRKVSEDIEITNYTLPQGCCVILSIFTTHMNPSLYPDPEKFDPERFTAEAVAKRHRYAFIPFSGGPRGCPGSKYAMLSMKTTISTILRSYKIFTSVKMEDIKLKSEVMIQSVNGFPIRLEHR